MGDAIGWFVRDRHGGGSHVFADGMSDFRDVLVSGGQLGRVSHARTRALSTPMSRAISHRILDQLNAGEADYSAQVIRRALIATGDLADNPPPRLGAA